MASGLDASTSRPHRYVALDSLRGVCACMVALLHFKTLGVIATSRLVGNAYLFVDFFFVLSGFVISASYGEKLTNGFPVGRFMILRLGRIYPLHLAVLIMFLVFEIWFAMFASNSANRIPFHGSFDLMSLAYSTFLIQPFFGPDGTPWNGPSWSIATEIWTYLIFALIYRFGAPFVIPASIVMAAVAPIYLSWVTDRNLYVFHDGAFMRCLYGFSLGVIGYRLVKNVPRAMPISYATIAEALVIAATVWVVIRSGSGPMSLIAPPMFLAAILIFSQERGWLSRALMLKPMVIVGTLSYSIYMIHVFMQYRLMNVLVIIGRKLSTPLTFKSEEAHTQIGLSPMFGDLMSILMLIFTICVAWFTYRFIEEPGRAWSRRVAIGRNPNKKEIRAEDNAPTF